MIVIRDKKNRDKFLVRWKKFGEEYWSGKRKPGKHLVAFFADKVPKDRRSQFLANLLIIEVEHFQKPFWRFLPTFKKQLF